MTLGFVADGLLYSRHRIPSGARMIATDGGDVHVRTSGDPAAPAIVLVPDGPFVVEHYDGLIARLSRDYFTVCFDLPGFGYSLPRVGYDHSFDAVVRVLEQVLDSMSLGRVTLAFTCANGFYALAFAARRPERVERLVLGQTPSFEAMMGWVEHVVPKPIRVPVAPGALGRARPARAGQARRRHHRRGAAGGAARQRRSGDARLRDHVAHGPSGLGAKVLGTDAVGWDRPFAVMRKAFHETGDATQIWDGHFAGREREVFIVQQLTNLESLPAHGFKVGFFPMKLAHCSAAPARVVAFLDSAELLRSSISRTG